jgi:hypothetical protein
VVLKLMIFHLVVVRVDLEDVEIVVDVDVAQATLDVVGASKMAEEGLEVRVIIQMYRYSTLIL